MRLHLLVNPAAGGGGAGQRFSLAARTLERLGAEFDVRFSEAPGHLTELAREAIRGCGADCVVAVLGGDGSLNEVINGLAGSRAALGIIPAGRGDDLARNLGIRREIEAACAGLVSGPVRTIDLVSAHGRLYAGIGGAGIDSQVTETANRSGLSIFGGAVYTGAVIRALASFKPFRFAITAEGWRYEGSVMFAGVANGPAYGGGLRLSPTSLLDDGMIEVCVVEEMSRLNLILNFPRLLRGTHLGHPRVRLFTARRLRMESDRPVDFYADGERIGPLPVEISVRPAALKVVAPLPHPPPGN